MSKKSLISFAISLTLVLSLAMAWLNRYAVYDWHIERTYTPSSEVQSLATNSSMSEEAKKLFFGGKPTITSGEQFNQKCQDFEETKVLGCLVSGAGSSNQYFGLGYEIYILNVTEPDLKGIQEVTAAHEMLHAAYDRLSDSERQKIDNELVNTFNNLKNSKLQKTVQSYADKDQTIVANELHSLLGTEVRELGPALEEYYSQYFDDRAKVVSIYEDYEAVFDAAKNEAERLYGSIQLLESQIKAQRARLDEQAGQLASQKAQMDQLRNSDVEAYNSMVPGYNGLVNRYNIGVSEIKALFDEYNSSVDQYNNLVVKQKQLIDAIDSDVIPESIGQ